LIQKKSLTPIPLSLREKKRYICFKLISSKPLNAGKVKKALDKTLLFLFGEVGLGRKGYSFIEFNSKTKKGIIRCKHTEEEEMKAGILFLKKIEDIDVIPVIESVSGTLKKSREKK
jgi:RNase P/RNase MRP subunit POP5